MKKDESGVRMAVKTVKPILKPGKYVCDGYGDTEYMCVADVKETAASFILKLDYEESARLYYETAARQTIGYVEGWDDMDDYGREFWTNERRRHFDTHTCFKDGKLTVKKSGSRHPIKVYSETEFSLNPFWGGTLWDFERMEA